MSTTASRIGQISLVCVPTTDQDRSIEFYEVARLREAHRHPVRRQVPLGRGLSARTARPDIALAPPRPGDEVSRQQTGIALTTDDIDATHAQLKARGVDVDAEVAPDGRPGPADVLVPRSRRPLADGRRAALRSLRGGVARSEGRATPLDGRRR